MGELCTHHRLEDAERLLLAVDGRPELAQAGVRPREQVVRHRNFQRLRSEEPTKTSRRQFFNCSHTES